MEGGGGMKLITILTIYSSGSPRPPQYSRAWDTLQRRRVGGERGVIQLFMPDISKRCGAARRTQNGMI